MVKSAHRPFLRALADRAGIFRSYRDQASVVRETTDRTRGALLAAMGIDASTEAAARRELERLADRDARWSPVRVVDRATARSLTLEHGPHPWLRHGVAAWELELEEEGGERRHAAGHARRSGASATTLRLPGPLPLGYHRLRVGLRGSGGQRDLREQLLIVTPGRCLTPREKLGRTRAYGVLAQLYTVRSEANWGIGDLGDLQRLIAWCGRRGAAFVGLNPLHALANRGDEISPYSPLSRFFRSVAYLDVGAIPELRHTPRVRGRIAAGPFRRTLARLRDASHVRYDRVMALKRPVLEALHRAFTARHGSAATARGRAYRRYRATEGECLTRFATFLALRDHLAPRRGRDWHQWPAAYRDPRSPAVAAFAASHDDEVDFHCYLQFEFDRQLEACAVKARAAGLDLGLYQDLAIGSSPIGADGWAFPDVFVDGVTLGAPPDLWYALGQDWGFHPLDPQRLAATGYRHWVQLVRNALAHAGALRIDHILGLFRQFWIPAGMPVSEGAYVRFPAADLLGILALESTRAGALVIGEDLGTIPRGLPATLSRWGVLSTRVFYFAKDRRGAFLPPRAYPADALVSANTHDMVPMAGYWRGRDLDLREASGQFSSAAAAGRARRERAAERRAILRRLAQEGVLPATDAQATGAQLRGAVHAFLDRTPAALLGVSLDDLTGEVEPVNQPGVTSRSVRNWSRRLRQPLERIAGDPDVATALGGIDRSARAQPRVRSC